MNEILHSGTLFICQFELRFCKRVLRWVNNCLLRGLLLPSTPQRWSMYRMLSKRHIDEGLALPLDSVMSRRPWQVFVRGTDTVSDWCHARWLRRDSTAEYLCLCQSGRPMISWVCFSNSHLHQSGRARAYALRRCFTLHDGNLKIIRSMVTSCPHFLSWTWRVGRYEQSLWVFQLTDRVMFVLTQLACWWILSETHQVVVSILGHMKKRVT